MKKNDSTLLHRLAFLLAGAILCVFLFFFISGEAKRLQYPSWGSFRATFLDIGQGDSTYLQFANKEDMLVDCGKDTAVVEALGRHMWFFDRTITTLVVTHPDRDHYGGCVDVLQRFSVQRVVLNGDTKLGDDFFQFFLEEVKREGARVVARTSTSTEHIGGTTLTWLYPDHDLRTNNRIPGSTKDTGSNNGSIVMRFDTGQKQRLLLTGDMEFPLEDYLIQKDAAALRAEVLKVGHHGSGGSTGDRFMEAVQPHVGMISVGQHNRYGHPSPRVTARLKRYHAAVWRTDEKGDIMALFGDSSLMVHAQK